MLNSAFLPWVRITTGSPTPLSLPAAREGPAASPPLLPVPACSAHHSFHPVGQEQDDSVVPNPLGLAGADELVYYTLSCVVKIPKLGFPAHQGIGTRHSKAKFKT